MIRAVMYWERLRLEVDGHAGADEYGKDIVCAGTSMLVTALARTLQEQELRGRLKVTIREEKDRYTVIADPLMGHLNEIKAYFRMTVIGLRMLAEEYREYVNIKEVG